MTPDVAPVPKHSRHQPVLGEANNVAAGLGEPSNVAAGLSESSDLVAGLGEPSSVAAGPVPAVLLGPSRAP